jgi:hypothetical protein
MDGLLQSFLISRDRVNKWEKVATMFLGTRTLPLLQTMDSAYCAQGTRKKARS